MDLETGGVDKVSIEWAAWPPIFFLIILAVDERLRSYFFYYKQFIACSIFSRLFSFHLCIVKARYPIS